jgi:hypothetical protein
LRRRFQTADHPEQTLDGDQRDGDVVLLDKATRLVGQGAGGNHKMPAAPSVSTIQQKSRTTATPTRCTHHGTCAVSLTMSSTELTLRRAMPSPDGDAWCRPAAPERLPADRREIGPAPNIPYN